MIDNGYMDERSILSDHAKCRDMVLILTECRQLKHNPPKVVVPAQCVKHTCIS